MTIRDPEVLEALRDEPELLALADAVTETQRMPRPARRRVVSRAVALVGVGVAALIAVLLWPSGAGRNGILDRALAAIGNGEVLHLVTSQPVGETFVNLRTGKVLVPSFEIESWSDRDSKRMHAIFRENGRVFGEFLLPQDQSRDFSIGAIDPAYAALWTGYRQALASGQAKIERENRAYGRPVYWLRFTSTGSEVAIDRMTYKPLVLRYSSGSRHFDSRVLLAQTEPFSASDFTRQTSRPNPLSGVGSGEMTQSTPVTPGSSAKPWLRAGPEVGGVKLAGVNQTQTQTVPNGKTTNGFELVYGSDTDVRRSVIIEESKHPSDLSEWKRIPEGSMRVAEGESGDNDSSYPTWTGELVVNGVYVSIQTGLSRAAVLEAARSLRPV